MKEQGPSITESEHGQSHTDGAATAGSGRPGFFVLALLLGLFLLPAVKAAQDETAEILDSAESLFKAMKLKNYPEIWTRLTGRIP